MDREQLARECLKIEEAGGSVREYLANCGCISPWGTWYRLQKEELHRQSWQIKDGKEGKDMAKITLEIKKKAVDIALKGGHPTSYLKEQGVKNPSSTWYVIKKNLEKVDPEKYARVMAAASKEDDDEIKATPVTDEQAVPKMDLTIKSEDLMRATAEPEIIAQTNYGGFNVTAIHDPDLGEFYHDMKFRCMDWRLDNGDEVSLSIDGWHKLIEKLPEIMKILGI